MYSMCDAEAYIHVCDTYLSICITYVVHTTYIWCSHVHTYYIYSGTHVHTKKEHLDFIHMVPPGSLNITEGWTQNEPLMNH